MGLLAQSKPCSEGGTYPSIVTNASHTVLAVTWGLLNGWAVLSCHALLQSLGADTVRGWAGCSPALAIS